MSTIPLRVAEVEARLHLVRRRINAFTLQHVTFLGLSALAVLAAILIAVGLRASAETFRLAAWGGVAVALAAAAVCAGILAVRWVDLKHAAELTDRRSGLSDRLTTLMSMRGRSRQPYLAPLLITQLLDMRARWRPEVVAPRSLPRSAFVFLASLLLLASTAFLERASIEAAAKAGGGEEAESRFSKSHEPPRPQPRSQDPGDVAGGAIDEERLQAALDGTTGHAAGLDASGMDDGSSPIEGTSELSELPDRLQDAIRRAFRAEPMEDMRSLGSIPDEPASGRGQGRQREERGPESDGDSVAAAGDREARGETDRPPAEQPPLAGNQKGDPKERTGQRRDGIGEKGQRPGSSAGAGDGSGTRPSVGDKADLGNFEGEPTTFKLTLSSFLAAVESRGMPQWNGKGSSAPGGTEQAGRGLNDRQLKDDVLRKPEIPPEYEDVVRRAYSAGK